MSSTWNHPYLDSQTESDKSHFVNVAADSAIYVTTLWFVIVPSIYHAVRAAITELGRNYMVYAVPLFSVM